MRLLAARKEPENVKALNELITKEASYWRQRSYAALALTVYSAAYREPSLEPATIEAWLSAWSYDDGVWANLSNIEHWIERSRR